MADGQLDCVLRHIRRLIGLPCAGNMTDGQLLERFATQHDEAAFEALLQRHGRLVLGVCRRILRDPHAAEDAFQATFLVLARKASSIRKLESISSWLYGVAYRLAVRAKSDAARRRAHERQVEPVPSPDPLAEVVRRDLRPVLDEELSRLPEKYRAALVLCYLQGKTNEQAARELGWPPGTMSRRLARGRELLRIRLTGRGVTLSTALLVTALAEEVSAVTVPAILMHSTLKAALLFVAGQAAAAGVISGQVAALAEGVLKAMWITKLKIGAAVLAVMVITTGTGIVTHAALAGRQASARPEEAGLSTEHPAAPKQEPSRPPDAKQNVQGPGRAIPTVPSLSVSGQVVDSRGKPIAGAAVYLREWRIGRSLNSDSRINDSIARATTDAQGRFAFREVPVSESSYPWDIRVMAKGYGLAFQRLTLDSQPLLLTMMPEAKIQGRLLDSEGRPAAGVRVRVIQVAHLSQPMRPSSTGYLDLQSTHSPSDTTTDALGGFVLAGLPPDNRVVLLVQDDRFARQRIIAATSDRPPPRLFYSEITLQGKSVDRTEIIHPAQFTATLQPGHRLRGRVLSEDDGMPVANSYLTLEPLSQSRNIFKQSFEARTDSEGHFSIPQLFPDRYLVSVAPREKGLNLGANSTTEIVVGKRESMLEIRLPRGTIITGSVVDEETGQGISGVALTYKAEEGEPGQPRTTPSSAWVGPRGMSGPDGRFRIVIPARKGELRVQATVPGYVAPERLRTFYSTPDKGLVHQCDPIPGKPLDGVRIALNRGLVITGRVLDPEGKLVAGARLDLDPGGPTEPGLLTDAGGRFQLAGLRSDVPHTFYAFHPERRLASLITVAQEMDKKTAFVEVRLRPAGSVTGRVLDEDGKPLPGALVCLYLVQRYRGYAASFPLASTATVDKQGQFRVDSLVPDGEYRVHASASDYTGMEAEFTAHSGAVHRMPDWRLSKTDRSIGGVVLDPGGNPLAGIEVSAEPVGRSRPFLGNPPPRVKTDEKGRFQLLGLPKGRVAVRASVLGTPSSLTALVPFIASQTVRAQAGEQDVRIMLAVPQGNNAGEAVVGKPAPDFAVRIWLQRSIAPVGKGFSRDDFRGKVVLLAFLDEAKPSQRLLPQLNQLHEKLADKGLVIVRIQEVDANRQATMEKELAKLSPTAAALVAPGLLAGGYSEAFQKYGVKATPTLFLIDRQGVLRYSDVEPDSLSARCEELVKP